MKVAIMQPYFLPYIGYFNLMAEVDVFVVYDQIKYTKKGWINRNRFLRNGSDVIFSVLLDKAADSAFVSERSVSKSFDRRKLILQFEGAYRKAPFYSEAITVLRQIIHYDENSLFSYIFNSIAVLHEQFQLKSRLIISSAIKPYDGRSGEDRVIDICRELGATHYVNPPGGRHLYDTSKFAKESIQLQFINPSLREYSQGQSNFIAGLSIVDVMMFNGIDRASSMIKSDFEVV